MTNRLPTPPDARTVIVGVDTHKHVHVAVATIGRRAWRTSSSGTAWHVRSSIGEGFRARSSAGQMGLKRR